MKKAIDPIPALPAKIVVGVDDAGLSDDAVRTALELGRRFSAQVRLVHAVPTPPDVWPGIDPVRGAALTAELLAGAHRVINEHVRSVVRAGAGAPARSVAATSTALLETPPGQDLVRVIPGPPARVLLEEVRETGADWIVLGGHRKRGLLDFGSTMRAIFAKATVPVWVQARPSRQIERILAPVDLSEDSLDALATACALAKSLGARVHALHSFHLSAYATTGALDPTGTSQTFSFEEVEEGERARFEKAMRDYPWRGVDHTVEFVEGAPADVILERSGAADLVVLGTHGRTGLASVVLGGTAYAVLKRSEKPVLATRRLERKFMI
jgi:nucleotide-binding universal stress UspA family protein